MSLMKNVANSVERIELVLEQHVRTTEFARFQFDWYERELKEITPTLWTVLEAAATSLDKDHKRKSAPVSSVPACAVAAAVLLKEQNLHMSAIQHLSSLLLWHAIHQPW